MGYGQLMPYMRQFYIELILDWPFGGTASIHLNNSHCEFFIPNRKHRRNTRNNEIYRQIEIKDYRLLFVWNNNAHLFTQSLLNFSGNSSYCIIALWAAQLYVINTELDDEGKKSLRSSANKPNYSYRENKYW